MRLSSELIETIRSEVEAKFSKSIDIDTLLNPPSSRQPSVQLESFFNLIFLLRSNQHDLKSSDLKRIVNIGSLILQQLGVRPSTSKLSYLYADLYQALSERSLKEGNRWLSLGYVETAKYLSRDALKQVSSGLSDVRRAFQLGDLDLAILLAKELETSIKDKEILIELRLLLIRCYRLKKDKISFKQNVTTLRALLDSDPIVDT